MKWIRKVWHFHWHLTLFLYWLCKLHAKRKWCWCRCNNDDDESIETNFDWLMLPWFLVGIWSMWKCFSSPFRCHRHCNRHRCVLTVQANQFTTVDVISVIKNIHSVTQMSIKSFCFCSLENETIFHFSAQFNFNQNCKFNSLARCDEREMKCIFFMHKIVWHEHILCLKFYHFPQEMHFHFEKYCCILKRQHTKKPTTDAKKKKMRWENHFHTRHIQLHSFRWMSAHLVLTTL